MKTILLLAVLLIGIQLNAQIENRKMFITENNDTIIAYSVLYTRDIYNKPQIKYYENKIDSTKEQIPVLKTIEGKIIKEYYLDKNNKIITDKKK